MGTTWEEQMGVGQVGTKPLREQVRVRVRIYLRPSTGSLKLGGSLGRRQGVQQDLLILPAWLWDSKCAHHTCFYT